MSATTPPQTLAPTVISNLRDLLTALRREIMADLNCAAPGTIHTFDAVKQTATIQLAMQAVVGDNPPVDYPILVDCPVVVLGGGGGALTFPVTQGDPCLVLFCDRAIDTWFTTGGSAPPPDQRMHSLSDGVALVGIRSLAQSLQDYPTDRVRLAFGGADVSLLAGKAVMESGAGAAMTLDDKISLTNKTQSLLTALDALITALTGWVDTRGDIPNDGTVTALNNAKAAVDALLK